MHTLSKKEIGDWIRLDYLAQKHVLEDKINFLRNKHASDFAAFENKIEQAATEDFAAWDDYLEWKAYRTFLAELLKKIDDVSNGDFQVA